MVSSKTDSSPLWSSELQRISLPRGRGRGRGESLAGVCRWGWYFQLGPRLIRVMACNQKCGRLWPLWLIDVSHCFGPPMFSLAGPSDLFGDDQIFELCLLFLWVDLCLLTPNIGHRVN